MTAKPWAKLYPRADGPWPAVRSGPEPGWARFHPEAGVLEPVDPLADEALPGLRVIAGSGQLIAYRVGRRAVLRKDPNFVKVVRPDKVAGVVTAHEWLASSKGSIRAPQIVATDPSGWFEMTAVPGRSLHRLMRAHQRLECEVSAAIGSVGERLAELHSLPAPAWAKPANGPEPIGWATIVGRFDPDLGDVLRTCAIALGVLEPRSSCVVHGDLHDKNVFVDGPAGSQVGLIDLDGLSLGAPEDDVANLAVHLHLRALQAGLGDAEGSARASRLVSAYRSVHDLDDERMSTATRHTWFRLSCLYRFRSATSQFCSDLLRRSLDER